MRLGVKKGYWRPCCLLAAAWALIFASEASAQSLKFDNTPEYRFQDVDLNFRSDEIDPFNVLSFETNESEAKSPILAAAFAGFAGFFLPAAFGHAYAEAHFETAVLTGSRLIGRLLTVYALWESFYINGAQGVLEDQYKTIFALGLALDIGGYIYDVVASPAATVAYNVDGERREPKIRPFINMRGGGPCCGLKMNF